MRDEYHMKRKWVGVGIMLLFMGICLFPVTAQDAKDSQSTSRGTWLYVGGSGPGNYTMIQDAINHASDGDTVFVYSGLYSEEIIVNHSITLLGENKVMTIIDGQEFTPGHSVTLSSDNVRVSGFTIQNCGEAFIVLSNSNEISGNLLTIIKYIGVDIKGNNNHIHDNEIRMMGTGIGCGIGILSCYNNTVSDNTIHGFLFGIKVQNCPDGYPNTIQRNEIYTSGKYGIFINLAVTNLRISGNSIDGNQRGIFFSLDGSCNTIHILCNIIKNSTEIGLFFEYPKSSGSAHNLIFRNIFLNNAVDFTFKVSKTRLRFFVLNNYWEEPHFLPVFLIGSQEAFGLAFHTYKVDLMPAKMKIK